MLEQETAISIIIKLNNILQYILSLCYNASRQMRQAQQDCAKCESPVVASTGLSSLFIINPYYLTFLSIIFNIQEYITLPASFPFIFPFHKSHKQQQYIPKTFLFFIPFPIPIILSQQSLYFYIYLEYSPSRILFYSSVDLYLQYIDFIFLFQYAMPQW